MQRLINYLKESRAELAKVDWPSRAQAIRLTLVVVVFSVVIAAFIGGVDYFFSNLMQKLILKS